MSKNPGVLALCDRVDIGPDEPYSARKCGAVRVVSPMRAARCSRGRLLSRHTSTITPAGDRLHTPSFKNSRGILMGCCYFVTLSACSSREKARQ